MAMPPSDHKIAGEGRLWVGPPGTDFSRPMSDHAVTGDGGPCAVLGCDLPQTPLEAAMWIWPEVSGHTHVIYTLNSDVRLVKEDVLLSKDSARSSAYHSKPGVKARLWRWIGRLFHRFEWEARGLYCCPADDPSMECETITLRECLFRAPDGTCVSFILGYNPKLDVLAVRRPVGVLPGQRRDIPEWQWRQQFLGEELAREGGEQ